MPLVHGIFVFLNSEVDELDHTVCDKHMCLILQTGFDVVVFV